MTERKLRIQIKSQNENLTIEQYLKKTLAFSRKQISRLKFREEGICVNGRKRRVDWRLHAGDWLEIRLESRKKDTLQLEASGESRQFSVLYEDADLLIVQKPSGLVCHPAHGHYRDTLANQVKFYGQEQGEAWDIRMIGRLDKDTSGLVVFAKNTEAAALLARQRECGIMKKTYLALAEGKIDPPAGCIAKPISRDTETPMKMKTDKDGKAAKTWYQVLKENGKVSLVQLQIEHGRTHQIRVHMASIGHPLAGDPIYGEARAATYAETCTEICAETEVTGCTALHAWRVELVQPFEGKRLSVEAPLPEWCRDF